MRFRNIQVALFALLAVLLPLDFFLIFKVAPTERIMGEVQRIFYLHVSMAISSYLSFATVFAASVLFLWRRNFLWDTVARSAAEIGVLFSTLVLVSGSLWARPVWNAWWTWDPRLVSMLVLWFIYVGYFLLRKGIPDWTRRAKYSAVIGIVGFMDVPIVRLATKWWRSIHPRLESEGGGLDPTMLKVMLFSIVTFSVFAVFLFLFRYRIASSEEKLAVIIKKMEE